MSAEAAAQRIRLDKWLWHARAFRTRTLAADAVKAGRIRVNGARCAKPGYGAKLGDVVTLVQGGRVRVLEITAFGSRRGPATEAAQLYTDLSDPPTSKSAIRSEDDSDADAA